VRGSSRCLTAFLISPMVVPLVITALALYFAFCPAATD
jgi:ABC-type spermidine/putrescine transport system permease subunit II